MLQIYMIQIIEDISKLIVKKKKKKWKFIEEQEGVSQMDHDLL